MAFSGCPAVQRIATLRDAQHLVGDVPSAGGRGERLSILFVKINHLVDGCTQLLKNRPLVVAMATAVKQSGTTADETSIFPGPLNNLDVTRAIFHLVLDRKK